MQFLAGKITVTVNATWDGDAPLIEIDDAVKVEPL
jgi:hypothetical protein